MNEEKNSETFSMLQNNTAHIYPEVGLPTVQHAADALARVEKANSLGANVACALQVWRSEQEKEYQQFVFKTKPNPV